MTNPSNSRRFVNAAWSLLTFQLIAAVGAVAVTGVAAFHVANLVGAQQPGAPVDAAVEATEAAPATADPAVPAQTAPAATPAARTNLGPGSVALETRVNVGIVAIVSDPDGMRGVRRIQWFRNGQLMPNAQGDTYPVGSDDNQAMIRARAEYVDANGNDEVAISEPLQAAYVIQ